MKQIYKSRKAVRNTRCSLVISLMSLEFGAVLKRVAFKNYNPNDLFDGRVGGGEWVTKCRVRF